MADPIFDKEGNLTNLDELDRDEVAKAYSEKNREVFSRATEEKKKREEAEAALAKAKSDLEAQKPKAPEAPTAPSAPVIQQPPQPDVSELRLMMGLTDEAILEANDIAKGKGISFKEAIQTPVFKAYQATEQAKKDAEDAKLPASKGSSQYVPPEGIKPGQTKDEHEAAWRKAMGGKDTA